MVRRRLLAVLATATIGLAASVAPLAALEAVTSEDVLAPADVEDTVETAVATAAAPAPHVDGAFAGAAFETALDRHPLENLVRGLALVLVLATTSLTGLIGQRSGLAHRPG